MQTYNIPVDIAVLDGPNRFHRGLLESHGNCNGH